MGFSTDYSLYPKAFLEGMMYDAYPHDLSQPYPANSAGNTAQVVTITVGTAATSTAYNVQVGNFSASYLSGGSDTAALIQAGLIAAINGNPDIYGLVRATATSGNNVLVTSRIAGTGNGWNVSVSGGGTGYAASVTTAATNAGLIPFGRLICSVSTDPPKSGRVINAAPSNTNLIRGVSKRTAVLETQYRPDSGTGAVEGYPVGEPMECVRKGRIAVVTVNPVTPFSDIYVYTSGVNQGRFNGAADTGAVLLNVAGGTGFAWATPTQAGFQNTGMAILEVNIP